MIERIASTSSFGVGDCEAIRDGFLHQPANALSSLVFLLAAAWIVWRATKVPAERPELLALAAIVAANGVGSFGFHGPFGASFRWFHDLSALSVPLFVVVHDAGLVRGVAVRPAPAGAGGGRRGHRRPARDLAAPARAARVRRRGGGRAGGAGRVPRRVPAAARERHRGADRRVGARARRARAGGARVPAREEHVALVSPAEPAAGFTPPGICWSRWARSPMRGRRSSCGAILSRCAAADRPPA